MIKASGTLSPVTCRLFLVACVLFRTRPAAAVRRGAALVMAMVALLVVTLVAGALVSSLIAAHRQSHRYADELQAQWLAEAGLARAAAKLRADASYTGEVWTPQIGAHEPQADAAQGAGTGTVTITVEPGTKRVTSLAVYPNDEFRRVLVRRDSGGGAP